jgi:hypothetical protein
MKSSNEKDAKNWHEIAVVEVGTIKEHFDLFRNILTGDTYFYVFSDLLKILTEWFETIISSAGGDLTNIEIRCAIHKLSISSAAMLYELAYGKITYEQFYNLIVTWNTTCPYVLHPYLSL